MSRTRTVLKVCQQTLVAFTPTIGHDELYCLEVTLDGPRFTPIYTDARSVLLTGRAASKEVRFAQESPANQTKILGAMAREWPSGKSSRRRAP